MVSYRIRWKDLAVVECSGKFCRKSRVKFPEATKVAQLFLKNGTLGLIRDGRFLMGGFSGGKAIGKRIDVLPDGTKLSRGFPLFGKGLMIHDEKSHGHWDVIFENTSGGFCYVYSLEKMNISRDRKYALVGKFGECLPRLRKNLLKALSSKGSGIGEKGLAVGDGDLVLAMLILLKTRMRVGCEVYYKRSRHKGLTTLKKKDLKIFGNKVKFSFVGKDGVPQVLEERFDGNVMVELKRVLSMRRDNDFIFLFPGKGPGFKGRILRDTDFEAGFERFCGERFYPHIVRSHFATREVERFLKREKGEARKFCLGLAGKLGHKKLIKGKWEDNFEVTLHSYVRGDLVERIRKLV